MKSLRLLTVFACALWAWSARAELDLTSATVADLNAAFAKGTLTSEKLTQFYLARIAAFDKQGPTINAIITLNPKALEIARTLDAERKAGKVRGPLHGIPIALKDNYDTFDLPTTAGSQLLEGSLPPDDAFCVKKLRDAGAIILAKVNLSEFAGAAGGGARGARAGAAATDAAPAAPRGGGPQSTLGGLTVNPHDLTKGPAGSSGGTGAAIAAAFAQLGTGSDTSGSIRGPCAANGIAGLKPTLGLISRDGIVPFALSFDTGGPMARSVYDVAVMLGVMTGVDPADPATAASAGKFKTDYTQFLKVGSLKGARIGVVRDFFGQSPETDRIMEESIATLKKLGAVVVDPIKLPESMMNTRGSISSLIMESEFKAQIADYLKTTKPGYPRTLTDLAAKAADPATGYRNESRKLGFKRNDEQALALDDPLYLVAKNEGRAFTKATLLAVFEKHKLDAMVYPTSPRPATPIGGAAAAGGDTAAAGTAGRGGAGGASPASLANQSGFPDLIVPAGMTKDGLPVAISFFGVAWSEPKLLGYGFDFEQATHARVLPKNTPKLATSVASN